MSISSIDEFQSTLGLRWEPSDSYGNRFFGFWNNGMVASSRYDAKGILCVIQHADGSFQLQIDNLVHRGSLDELEEVLYGWAFDEEWLD